MSITESAPSATENIFDISDYIELNDAAKSLGVAPYWLRNASKEGKLPVKVLGSRTLVSKTNLRAFLENGESLVTRRNKPGAGGKKPVTKAKAHTAATEPVAA